MPDTDQQPRRPGRPRTRPVGAKKRSLYLTDDEFARVGTRAATAGVSAEEWMRRTVTTAATLRRR